MDQFNLNSHKGVLSYDCIDENKYIIHSRISEAKTREILKYFCLDIKASKIAKITHISEVALCKIFKQMRILIAQECEKTSTMQGEIDESCFTAKKVIGKRGRGAGNKTAVFLLLHYVFVTASARGYAKHRLSKLKASKKKILCST